jgi:hypothetical protein
MKDKCEHELNSLGTCNKCGTFYRKDTYKMTGSVLSEVEWKNVDGKMMWVYKSHSDAYDKFIGKNN